MSTELLRTTLSDRFTGIRFEDISERNRLLTWQFNAKHGPIDGYLNRKKQVVVLNGDVRDCAEFVRWYRSIVDPQYELVFPRRLLYDCAPHGHDAKTLGEGLQISLM